MGEAEILQHVIDGMVQRNLIRSEADIVTRHVARKTYSYVVYDHAYEKNTALIRDWFSAQNLHLGGRFGFFEYLNVDGIIWRNLQLAEKLNGHPVKLEGRQILK
jgi:protoporphyrinogen oxidase